MCFEGGHVNLIIDTLIGQYWINYFMNLSLINFMNLSNMVNGISKF